jgi:arylformamidase
MRVKYLSYPLQNTMPGYGGMVSLGLSSIKSISKGDTANVSKIAIESHWGTHIDLPAHFFNTGHTIIDYPPEFWFFKRPQVIKVSLRPSEILHCSSLPKDIDPHADILLFQSGWHSLRAHEDYRVNNPGIHPDVGLYLREKCKELKAVGIDWISLSAFRDRELGRQSHRVFLDPKGANQPVLIVEDMDLSCDLTGVEVVFVFPLRVEGFDSAPCTAIARFRD